MSLSTMSNASNERRLQAIMRLRVAFSHQEVVTVASAAERFSVSEKTALSYAKEGDIPLLDASGKPVVEMNPLNTPAWLRALTA